MRRHPIDHPLMRTVGMDTDLTAVKAALAEISDTELAALIAETYGSRQTAPEPDP